MSGGLRYLVIPLTLVIGFVLLILPLPEWAQIYRPNWLALFLIYWSMALPNRVSLWAAFITGLFMDTAQGALFGQHALALVIIIYFNVNLHQRIRVLTLAQQAIYVFGLLLIYQVVIAWIEGILGRSTPVMAFFGAPVIGMLIWPWIFVILRDVRRKAALN